MKKFVIVLLSLTLVFGLPIEDKNLEDDEPEDGWFVPQLNGSFVYVTEEEAQLKTRVLTMSRAKKPKEAIVEFYLYSKYFSETPVPIFIGDVYSVKGAVFDPSDPTRIIIHGWQNTFQSDVNTEIREAFYSTGDYNIISVDWSDKASSLNYHYAATAVPEIGQKVADMIEFLRDELDMQMKDLKVIGHSLGAHVAGYAGKLIKGEKIHTIIGLDTAYPLFNYDKCETRLCVTDANYVESIHTNGKLLGFIQPIGHTAFYPNGGKTQPGCGIDISGTCSHSRAYTYYAEAIKSDFFGVKCNNWKKAVKKDCQFSGFQSVARFNTQEYHQAVGGTFYNPVNQKSPYGLSNE